MEIKPRLLHQNQGYGDFKQCPFCGGDPLFSVHFYEWVNKADYHVQEADEFPTETAGVIVNVCCPKCTISMRTPYTPRNGYPQGKEVLLSSNFYKDKFGDLLHKWNRRSRDTATSNVVACAHNVVVNLNRDSNSAINWPRVWEKRERLKEALDILKEFEQPRI